MLIHSAKCTKQKQCTESQMKAAIESVHSGKNVFSKSCMLPHIDHGTPSTTLKDERSSYVRIRVKQISTGPDRYFTTVKKANFLHS